MAEIYEIEQLLKCAGNHEDRPILWVLKDKTLKIQQRLLCEICANQRGALAAWNYQNMKRQIQERQNQLSESFKTKANATKQQILSFTDQIDSIKQSIIQSFDTMVSKIDIWFNDLATIENQINQFNLLEKFDQMDVTFEEENMKNIQQLQQCNQSYFDKLANDLRNLQIDDALEKCYKTFYNLFKNNDFKTQSVDLRAVQVQINNKQETPYIDCVCPIHNKKIIFVNVKKEINQKSRVACIECERSNQIPVVEFSENWQNFLNKKEKKIKECQKKQQKILEECISFLNLINKQQSVRLHALIHEIQKKLLFGMNNQRQNDFASLSQLETIIDMAEELSMQENDFLSDIEQNYAKLTKEIHLKATSELEKIVQEQSNNIQSLNKGFLEISYEQIGNNIKQTEQCYATEYILQFLYLRGQLQIFIFNKIIREKQFCFNKNGNIMISGFGYNIRVWEFNQGILKSQITLKGYHRSFVTCLIYSKKSDWFLSGSYDNTIQCWKQTNKNKWIVQQPKIKHQDCVSCILMNQKEDEVISGSWDQTIKIWKVYDDINTIKYLYSLNEHQGLILGISLNESETYLVSGGGDQKIIIWRFHQVITLEVNDFGHRISFIGDGTIAQQQASKGVTHFFQLMQGSFLEMPNLRLELNTLSQDDNFFPTIYNKSQNLIIQKHNRFVYILKYDFLEKFILATDPIDCECDLITGGLTYDGQYLILWDQASKEFRTYRINQIQ